MAVCKRCGKTFDYDKRDGVCPKCCFYNRPAGTWQEDESWIKNYNYEDNSYDVTLHESNIPESSSDIKLSRYFKEKDQNDVGPRLKDILSHKEMDGSHTHLDNGQVIRGSKPYYGKQATGKQTRKATKTYGKTGQSGKSAVGAWIFVIIIIYYIIGMFLR